MPDQPAGGSDPALPEPPRPTDPTGARPSYPADPVTAEVPAAPTSAAGATGSTADSGGRGGAKHRRSSTGVKRSRWPRRVVIGLGSLVIVAVLLAAGGYWYVNYRFDQIHKVTVHNLHHAPPGQPFNVLLVGSDSRAFVDTSGGCQAFGCGSSQGGQRSDVIVIVRVVPATRQVTMLSIPRDTWVDIPGKVPYVSGQNRINVAFNDGPSLLVETIGKDFHIPISYFVEVNFPGLQNMVDAIGGIHLHFSYPLRDAYSGLNVPNTGCQLIHGGTALALVRSRHLEYYANGQWNSDYGSDFSRIHNQQAFFRAVISTLNSQITNPLRVNSFIGAAAHDLTIDQTLTRDTLITLAQEFHNFAPGALQTETLPTVGPYVTSGGAEVLLPAAGPDQAMIESFLSLGTSHPSPGTSTTSTPPTTSAGSTSTTAPGGSTTTAPNSKTTVTTVAPAPAGEAPIYNTQVNAWTPTPC